MAGLTPGRPSSGAKGRIIKTGGAGASSYGTSELTVLGIVGTGGATITLTEDVLPGTRDESVLLVILATIHSDDSSGLLVPIDSFSFQIGDGTLNQKPPCEANCYPDAFGIDLQQSNSFLTQSPVPCGAATYVFQKLPAGTVITLTPDAAGHAPLIAIQSLAVVVTQVKAEGGIDVPSSHFWNSNFIGERIDGKGSPTAASEAPDDCKGAQDSTTTPWNAAAGSFSDGITSIPIASDIAMIFGAAKAYGETNPDNLLFFFSAFRVPFDQGSVSWDLTTLATHTGTAAFLIPELGGGSFNPAWTVVWGFKLVTPPSFGFFTQWACPGTYDPGIPFSRDIPVSFFLATIAGGVGQPCCARGIIVADNFNETWPKPAVAP